MRETVSAIQTWAWFSEPHGYDFNGHLVRHAGGNICIDPVEPSDAELDAITDAGVSHIVLTNRNHSRAANQIRARTGAKTLIHADDADHARSQDTEIDGALTVGGRIGPFDVIAAAGKSPGEIALFWPERKILMVGDAVIGNPPGACALLPERVMDDPDRLRQSVREFLALDFDTLLVGDGVAILEDAKAQLQELVETFAG